MTEERVCDSCKEWVYPDRNGYWVHAGTSDCKVSPDGHTVDGKVYYV